MGPDDEIRAAWAVAGLELGPDGEIAAAWLDVGAGDERGGQADDEAREHGEGGGHTP